MILELLLSRKETLEGIERNQGFFTGFGFRKVVIMVPFMKTGKPGKELA